MKYDINDLTDTQLNLLVAKAQGYEVIDHYTWVGVSPTTEMYLDDYQKYIHYDPISYWDQTGELLEAYKPFISPTNNGIVVEIMDETSSVESRLGINYAVAKHPDNIQLALCRAIVAYHYGYEIEIQFVKFFL